MVQAINLRLAGDPEAARAAAEEALRLAAEGDPNAALIEVEAEKLLSELDAEATKEAGPGVEAVGGGV